MILLGAEMDWMASFDLDDEYEKLIVRMNPPRVVIDNTTCENATIVQVDSANKHGILLEVVQVLTDLNLSISKAYISSDGGWFMDVFHVTDQDGKKLTEEGVIDYIQQGLRLELCTSDRVGLLSDVTRIFRENGLSVTRAEVTTRGEKAVNAFYVTDAAGNPVDSKTVDAVRREIGQTILQVKESSTYGKSPPRETAVKFLFSNLFRSKSLYNLGLIKSYS